MSRDYKIYLNDILKAIERIERYAGKLTKENFVEDELVVDGVVRNLEIIGEAVKNIPKDIKDKYPKMDWKKIVGFRDILIHGYFSVNFEIVWEIITNRVPELKKCVKNILNNNIKKDKE